MIRDDLKLGLTSLCVFGVIHATIILLTTRLIPSPIMGELPHVLFTQKLCENFNQKQQPFLPSSSAGGEITLPGLHFIGLALGKLVGGSCELWRLRLVSSLSVSFLFFTLFSINRILHPHLTRSQSILKAISETIITPLLPHTLLFLPDSLSSFLVFAMLCQSLLKRHILSSFIGSLLLLVRPLSAPWIVFCWINSILSECHDLVSKSSFKQFFRWCLRNIHLVVPISLPYIVVCFAFLSFLLIHNGTFNIFSLSGITKIHPVYLLHLSIWLFVSLLPTIFAFFIRFLKSGAVPTRDPRKTLLYFLLFTFICVIILWMDPSIHHGMWEILLGEFSTLHLRIVLAPLASFSGLIIWHLLGRQLSSPIWWIAFVICTSLSLLPCSNSTEIELRDLVIPILIVRVFISPPPELVKPSISRFISSPIGPILMNILLSSIFDILILGLFFLNPFRRQTPLME